MVVNEQEKSGWILIAQLIGYILVFAVPAAVLSLLFPKYTGWFVITAAILMFVGVGIMLGKSWDSPEMTPELRKMIASMGLIFAVMWPIVDVIWDTVSDRSLDELWIGCVKVVSTVAVIYVPFFISRAYYRRVGG